MRRRHFLQALAASALARPLRPLRPDAWRLGEDAPAIDRRARVARHSPVIRAADQFAVLSVGNGAFTFTADVTGLQTFASEYKEIPLATQAEWGWHSFPNPQGYRLEQALVAYDAHGRAVPYASAQSSAAGRWLRENPHRLSLARLGLELRRRDGSPATLADVHDIEQRLDLWTGMLDSRYSVDGRAMRVRTWVHPERDVIATRVEWSGEGPDAALFVELPYGAATHTGDPADWTHPELHHTAIVRRTRESMTLRHMLDESAYVARACWSGDATMRQQGAHRFRVMSARGSRRLDLVLELAPGERTPELPTIDDVRTASAHHWARFWSSGGVVDLSASNDPRAQELERRIVLSEYLTAIQCAGTRPPQETGETFNSWYGKFHLEMHWWHAAHFALWNRTALLERSLPWYRGILPRARETARMQGYAGARWPKMVGPEGRESPSGVGVFLIWQQPHSIYLAELVYRARRDRRVLDEYAELVHETATFMASYPWWDADAQRYMLGPPLIPAQESHPPATTFNPTFELAYWEFGLSVAQRWRERRGLPRDETWDRVIAKLSALPMRDGLYVNAESAPDTFEHAEQRRDHPTLLAAYGFVGSPRVDRDAMRRTLRRTLESWQWADTWGWDYPMVAMTATRLGEPSLAVDALLMDTPKNRYLPNGHNYQRPGLTIYLPGNGGLLSAAAMMAAGWNGAPTTRTPGFPAAWRVQWDQLQAMP